MYVTFGTFINTITPQKREWLSVGVSEFVVSFRKIKPVGHPDPEAREKGLLMF